MVTSIMSFYAEDEEFYTNNTDDFPCYIKYINVESIEDVVVPDFNVGDQVIYNSEFEEESGVILSSPKIQTCNMLMT